MSPTAKSLGIDRLSLAVRLRPVEEIWDGILDDEGKLDVPRWQRDELDLSQAAYKATPAGGMTWDEFADWRPTSRLRHVPPTRGAGRHHRTFALPWRPWNGGRK